MSDPNAPNDPEGPAPEPTPEPPAPQSPQYDVNTAYDVIAQAEGWDPRLTRYEIQELKRKREEFDRERREFEAERAKRYEVPSDDTTDPYMREMRETRRLIMEDREEKRKEREQQSLINRLGTELNQTYTSLARQAGMTKEQLDSNSEEFYATLNELYPQPGMLQEMGVQNAARNAFRLMKNGNGGGMPSLPNPMRDRRAGVFIPGSAPSVSQPQQSEGETRRPGESLEDYVMRLRALAAKVGTSHSAAIPEGQRVTFE